MSVGKLLYMALKAALVSFALVMGYRAFQAHDYVRVAINALIVGYFSWSTMYLLRKAAE